MAADAKNRALSILVGYITQNRGVKLADLGPPFVGAGNTPLYNKTTPFLRGDRSLSDPEYDQAQRAIVRLLRTPKLADALRTDYPWLRGLLLETGLDPLILPGERDERPLDFELLRSLNLDFDDQNLARQRQLNQLIGGLWYVIRPATDKGLEPRRSAGAKHYNVALLNVKPQVYTGVEDGRYENVTAHLCHFSMRSKVWGGRREETQLFRGRVVEVDRATIHFIGDRFQVGQPKIFTMSWAYPSVEQHGRRATADSDAAPPAERAERARGVITTANASDVTVTGPVICLRVRIIKGLSALSEQADHADSKAFADRFQKVLNRAAANIDVFNHANLLKALQPVNEREPIARLLETLEDNLAEVKAEGYFRLSGH